MVKQPRVGINLEFNESDIGLGLITLKGDFWASQGPPDSYVCQFGQRGATVKSYGCFKPLPFLH